MTHTDIHPVSADPRVVAVNKKRTQYTAEDRRLRALEQSLLEQLSADGKGPSTPAEHALAAADALLKDDKIIDEPKHEITEELRETRRRIAILTNAINAADAELRAMRTAASRELMERLKPELDGFAIRMRDAIGEYRSTARDFLDVILAAERAGYEVPTPDTNQFYVPAGQTVDEMLAEQEMWLRRRGFPEDEPRAAPVARRARAA
jgi:hypothetical protein